MPQRRMTSMQRNAKRWPQRSGHVIVVYGVRWKYKIGRSYVVAYSELGHRALQSAWILNGFGDLERGRWKGTKEGMITPRKVICWLITANVQKPVDRSACPICGHVGANPYFFR